MADESADNWDIIGHSWAVEFLRRSLAGEHTAHAYLFSGPASIGKALLALRLAQALNCERGGSDPCRTCRSCKRIERGSHPDVRIAGMASQTAGLKADEAARQKDLKIDTVREWQSDIALRPYEGRRRVFILHDAERLNDSASNAMLKTLEEPPPDATIVLVANTAGDLLPTIVSRCQQLKLRPVPRAIIRDALQQRLHLTTEDATLLSAWSAGRVGWALRMAADPEQLERYREQIDGLVALAGNTRGERFRWAEEQAKAYRNGEQEQVFAALELWQGWWRDVLLLAAGRASDIVHVDRRDDIERAAQRYRLEDIHGFISRLGQTVQQLRENVNPQLAIENALLHLPTEQR